MKGYRFSDRFRKQYQALPPDIRKAFQQKLVLFLADRHHLSLRVKKLQGVENRCEGSITMKYRFTFHLDDDIVVFRAIGTHDILARES
jgi:mRNA-degrading endonuclease RelE of RelBE toxin-antitoxin system